MMQILLIIAGILSLIKGDIKISDTKKIVRPQSIYWGLIVIVYGIALSFLPSQLMYSLIFYGSLILISAIFMVTGQTIKSEEALVKSSNTKRNATILLIFVIIVVIAFYLALK